MIDNKNRNAGGFRKILKVAGLVILGILGATVIAFLFGFFVMLLWNWLMPSVFGVRELNFWEAFGFVLLIKLLFGGENGINIKSIREDHKKRKHFTADRKREIEDREWHEDLKTWEPDGSSENWKYFDSYWKKEGRQAFESYIQKIRERQDNE